MSDSDSNSDSDEYADDYHKITTTGSAELDEGEIHVDDEVKEKHYDYESVSDEEIVEFSIEYTYTNNMFLNISLLNTKNLKIIIRSKCLKKNMYPCGREIAINIKGKSIETIDIYHANELENQYSYYGNQDGTMLVEVKANIMVGQPCKSIITNDVYKIEYKIGTD
jgi:ribosomal protein L19